MVDLSHLIHNPNEREICVETKLGNAVEAKVGPLATFAEEQLFKQFLDTHRTGDWKVRKNASCEYNCAGMVWASRRALLNEEDDWSAIIEDDGYCSVRLEDCKADDLVVYFDASGSNIQHVGRILWIHRQDGAILQCIVLSKFGNQHGEVEHALETDFCKKMKWKWKIFTDREIRTDETA